jgi:hypothetical protein
MPLVALPTVPSGAAVVASQPFAEPLPGTVHAVGGDVLAHVHGGIVIVEDVAAKTPQAPAGEERTQPMTTLPMKGELGLGGAKHAALDDLPKVAATAALSHDAIVPTPR